MAGRTQSFSEVRQERHIVLKISRTAPPALEQLGTPLGLRISVGRRLLTQSSHLPVNVYTIEPVG